MNNDIYNIKIEEFNYELPDECIARHPLSERDKCKLLLYKDDEITEHLFCDVPRLLPQGAMLVYNNTKVINARLRFQKPNNGAIIEIFCLDPLAPRDYEQVFQTTQSCSWQCLVGNAKRWKAPHITSHIVVGEQHVTLTATRGERLGNAFEITFSWDNPEFTFATLLDAIGEIPIPPYLNRNTEPADSTDYQTVYSRVEGSVAAPTAGLHFTDTVLAQCDALGIARRELTLHVGAGTFQPVKSSIIGEHEMHTEFISVPRNLLVELVQGGRDVVAVGTTSVRTLESLYYIGAILHRNPNADEAELCVSQWMPYSDENNTLTTAQALQEIIDYLDRNHLSHYLGSTQIMIAPSFKFHIIKGMITNFHQPQSTLLLLVSAFVGGERWRDIYRFALNSDFRFLSYGDGSLLLR